MHLLNKGGDVADENLNVKITNRVAGDKWYFNRSFTFTDSPAQSVTFTKVYLTIKENETDEDDDAVFQEFITSSSTSRGQITDASSSDGAVAFNFRVLGDESVLLEPGVTYFYDFQGIDTDGEPYTFEIGKIKPRRGRTDATS